MRRRLKAQEIKESRTKRASSKSKRGRLKIFFLLLCMGGLGFCFLWISGFSSYFLAQIEKDFFIFTQNGGITLKTEMIEGAFRTSSEEIETVLNIKKGESLFKIDPWKAKENLEKLPWVQSALIERRFPETLYIRLSERQPIARWQHQKMVDLIDEKGKIISLQRTKRDSFASLSAEFSSLPLFVGEGAEKRGAAFLTYLKKYPLLLSRITASTLVSERRWNIYLDKSLEVRLPEEGVEQALQALANLDKQGVLSSNTLKIIDLRYLPKLIIRPREEDSKKGSFVPLSKKAKST